MPREAKPCIICGKELENVDVASTNQPSEGLNFYSHGQYGTTVFDPMNGEYLEINICDTCIVEKAKQGLVLHGRDRVPVTIGGSVIGFARRTWLTVEWNPEMESDEEDIRLDDWDDFRRTREQWPIETRFSDGELKRMFERYGS